MQGGYREDLAFIHDAGFGRLAQAAVGVLLRELRRSGHLAGTVVELGCGSGVSARLLCDAGYDVLGFDISEPALELARQRAPRARFIRASFVDAELPSCVAVTAVGEVLNYCFDDANDDAARTAVWARAHAALRPGGLLLFDLAGPARLPDVVPERSFVDADDWVVLVERDAEAGGQVLARRITTFRRQGESYRRGHELHRLQLVEAEAACGELERLGFEVQTLTQYGSLRLPRGLDGLLARKPCQGRD